jgi:hypothetical protein
MAAAEIKECLARFESKQLPDGISFALRASRAPRGWNGGAPKTADRCESNLTAIDPVTGEIKKTVHLQ